MGFFSAFAASTTLGRYRLVRELGRGGMGVVYRAILTGPQGFQRSCVIKRIVPDLAQNDGFVRALTAEAKLCGLLNHPNIVQVFEFGRSGRDYYLAMEYVEGLSLREVIGRSGRMGGPVPPGVACFIASELASALHYAHTLRDEDGRALAIVHRDVSPANVMLGRTGAVKLLDFGIAKAANHVRDGRTRTGTLKGTFAYVSPEQVNGLPAGPRSDLYALGIVLWETLTGKSLFGGQDDLHTLKLVREAKVEATGVDPELDAVVLRMLAADPQERFPDCEEANLALARIANRLDGNAAALRRLIDQLLTAPNDRPAPVTEMLSVEDVEPTSSRTGSRASGELVPGGTPAMPVERRRHRFSRSLIGVASLSLAGVIASIVLFSRGSNRNAERLPAASATAPSANMALPAEALPSTAVRIEVIGSSEAELLIDGKWYGMLPVDLRLPPQPTSRMIEVRREGFRPFVQMVAGNHDAKLAPLLVRKHKAKASSPKRTNEIKNPFDSSVSPR